MPDRGLRVTRCAVAWQIPGPTENLRRERAKYRRAEYSASRPRAVALSRRGDRRAVGIDGGQYMGPPRLARNQAALPANGFWTVLDHGQHCLVRHHARIGVVESL